MSNQKFDEMYKGNNTKELTALAKELGVPRYYTLNKKELVLAILEKQSESEEHYYASGILDDIHTENGVDYKKGETDIYISASQIRRFELKKGDEITGKVRKPRDGERYAGLLQVDLVNGVDAEVAKGRSHFQALTPIYPNQKIVLETTKEKLSTRFVDLVAPIGFGQRGLIVAPPKVGKTTLLKDIANAIRKNYPDKKLIILLIDERPEEVTDMERSVKGADVVSSTFDETSENHIKMAELVIEHAKRRVELGQDVIILMDSITRLGAARNVEGGGSLTIIATALINTGSRMDDLIFEEFKGTGNMEIVLSPELASRRIYPAIDFLKSSTRKEELLLTEDEVKILWQSRRKLEDVSEPTIGVLNHLRKYNSNEEYISEMKKFIRE